MYKQYTASVCIRTCLRFIIIMKMSFENLVDTHLTDLTNVLYRIQIGPHSARRKQQYFIRNYEKLIKYK